MARVDPEAANCMISWATPTGAYPYQASFPNKATQPGYFPLAGYIVLRAQGDGTDGNTFSEIGRTDVNTRYYLDENEEGQWTYAVCAYDTAGLVSEPSNFITITLFAP